MFTTSTLPPYPSPCWTDLDDEQKEAVRQVLQDTGKDDETMRVIFLAARSKLDEDSSLKTLWDKFDVDKREAVYETLIDQADRWEKQADKAVSRGLSTRVSRANKFRVAFASAATALGYVSPPYRYT